MFSSGYLPATSVIMLSMVRRQEGTPWVTLAHALGGQFDDGNHDDDDHDDKDDGHDDKGDDTCMCPYMGGEVV